jgi:hypothetical protein
MGNDDDSWTEEQHAAAWEELGGIVNTNYKPEGGEFNSYPSKEAYVYMRFTLEKQRIRNHLENAGEPLPTATDYIFCKSPSLLFYSHVFTVIIASLDGYPYSLMIGTRDWPRIAEGTDAPNADWKQHRWSHCELNHDVCFPKDKKASEIFEHVAFGDGKQCGDCSTYIM